jgi:copper resistance protein C
MQIRTLAAATLATGLLVAPAAADAHAPIDSRTPAPGSKVSNVTSVNITFGEGVVTGLISMTKDGQTVKPKTSGLSKKNTVLSETFAKALAKGTYTVSWRALADDGHHQSGTWDFTVK